MDKLYNKELTPRHISKVPEDPSVHRPEVASKSQLNLSWARLLTDVTLVVPVTSVSEMK